MKRILTVLLCLCMVVPFAACGGAEETSGTENTAASALPSSGTQNATSTDTSSGSSEEEWQPTHVVDNMVMVTDQHTQRIVVYNLDLIDPDEPLEMAEVWSCSGNSAGLKYREDTVFGDVILFSPGTIITYPEKKTLWVCSNAGSNPHSIEILPSGNVVTASSTDGIIRLFKTCALLEDDTATSKKYEEYQLPGAHGVLWDPEYDVLWAVGDYELVAYRVLGEGTEQTLSRVGGMGAEFPKGKEGGHDLAADFSSVNHLFVTTNTTVFRFDKETNELGKPENSKLNKAAVKGFGNNLNGNYFFTFPNGGPGTEWEDEGISDWCTDRIYYGYWKTENLFYLEQYVSETGAFYKCRVFCGKYQ